MKNILLLLGLAGLLVCCACSAQDPASPKLGNAQRGRALLSILGPKPHDAAGISPLQQQELNRRIRCAAMRQEIQDQLDFEAAGSSGFYVLSQLRATEQEICLPPPQIELPQATPQRPPQPLPSPPRLAPHATFSKVSTPPLLPPPVQTAAPPAPVVQIASDVPSYTPAPDYPKAEMDAGHEGSVMVQLVMNADGSVKAATVAQSCNYPILDAAALAAARTWRIPAAAGRTIKVPLKFSAH